MSRHDRLPRRLNSGGQHARAEALARLAEARPNPAWRAFCSAPAAAAGPADTDWQAAPVLIRPLDCPKPEKTKFLTEADALAGLDRRRENDSYGTLTADRVYRCNPGCGAWHLATTR